MSTIAIPRVIPGQRQSAEIPKVRTNSKHVLVCGSGRCLWDDMRALGPFDGDVMAVNYAGIFLPRTPLHWVSSHADDFQFMLPMRPNRVTAPQGWLAERIETHSDRPCLGVLHVWPKFVAGWGNGSSSIGAVRIALQMYERVILAGVPLDESGHFYDPPNDLRQSVEDHRVWVDTWRGAVDEFKGRVRSMSGATRELLGAP